MFTDDKILYVENIKDFTLKQTNKNNPKYLLELTSDFSKFERYKLTSQKSVGFLYINNHKTNMKLKKSIHSKSKIVKYLEINLTKQLKDLYTEIYKIMLEELKTNK